MQLKRFLTQEYLGNYYLGHIEEKKRIKYQLTPAVKPTKELRKVKAHKTKKSQ